MQLQETFGQQDSIPAQVCLDTNTQNQSKPHNNHFIIPTNSSNQKFLTKPKHEILFARLRWQIWYQQHKKERKLQQDFYVPT